MLIRASLQCWKGSYIIKLRNQGTKKDDYIGLNLQTQRKGKRRKKRITFLLPWSLPKSMQDPEQLGMVQHLVRSQELHLALSCGCQKLENLGDHLLFPGCALAGRWNQVQIQDSNPGTLIWHKGVWVFQVVLNRCIEKHSPSPPDLSFLKLVGKTERQREGGEKREVEEGKE